jgi:hypothetical protein
LPFGRGETPTGVTVWGYTPNSGRTQADLIYLFAEQKRLTAVLLKQSRLLKVAVEEVRSTEHEHLRRVNQAILAPHSGQAGFSNPFDHRRVNDAQRITEDMLARQGIKVINSAKPPKRPLPPPVAPTNRRRNLERGTRPSGEYHAHLEDLLDLRGPLARDYARSVRRGYQGPPAKWLRGPKAEKLIASLSRRGFPPPPHGGWTLFQRNSPLHWAVNAASGIAGISLPHGFARERIRTEPENFSVIRRQAGSVQRLSLKLWPSSNGRRSWPTFPTLNESWERYCRSIRPPVSQFGDLPAPWLGCRRPTRAVKPGSSARVVSKLVLGIRADIEVPKKFLGYFRYRWGFLILIRRYRLPKGLVQFLAKRWKSDITEMFLLYPVRYNDALRRIPPSSYYEMVGFTLGVGRPKGPDSTGRQRPGKCERRAEALRRSSTAKDCVSPPLMDKSGGGVRLC